MTIILQHEKNTPPGSVIQWLEFNKKPYHICKLFQNDTLPEAKDFKNLFICGGSMNVDQKNQFSWLSKEKDLIRTSILEKKKIIGLCLGGQLLAEALGGQVGPMASSEVGWSDMTISKNKIIGTNAINLKVFQWHSYCFYEVPDTNSFATNSAWKYQGFTYNHHVIAFQFHPEATTEWILECSEDKKLPKGIFCQTSQEIKAALFQQKNMENLFFKILNHFFENNS